MNSRPITLTVLALCIVLVSSVPLHIRQRRRVKPRTDKPLDLTELRRQCIHHGWTWCSDEANEMSHPNSSFNRNYLQCQEEALQGYLNNVDLLELPGNNTASTAEPECPASVVKQRIPARNTYCENFKEISMLASLFLASNYYLNLQKLIPCVQWKRSDNELTPQEIVNMLNLWVKKIAEEHSGKCCGEITTLKPANKIENRLQARENVNCLLPVNFTWLPSYTAQEWWDEKLARIVQLMKAVELLENIGRRRKCLRGCVSLAEVQCVQPLL